MRSALKQQKIILLTPPYFPLIITYDSPIFAIQILLGIFKIHSNKTSSFPSQFKLDIYYCLFNIILLFIQLFISKFIQTEMHHLSNL